MLWFPPFPPVTLCACEHSQWGRDRYSRKTYEQDGKEAAQIDEKWHREWEKREKEKKENAQVAFKVQIVKPIDWLLPVYSLGLALWCLSLRRASAWDLCEYVSVFMYSMHVCVCRCVGLWMCVLPCREQVNWLVAHVHRWYLSLWSLFVSELAWRMLKMNHKLTLNLSAAATNNFYLFLFALFLSSNCLVSHALFVSSQRLPPQHFSSVVLPFPPSIPTVQ